ncbi:hypothetical protein Vretimale_961 [Volvox reticuliferus]|uniref:Uncharacterized protein n=2 Tax=Volvox reticuliferus TaxID=1737510 RepID=A0A8J4G1H9_9CHLO|nr:hypothetical protein Vretimale_961 [Volvox reticuliferus]
MLEKIAKLHQQTENSTKTGHTSAAGETSEAPPRKAMAAEVKQQPEQLEQPMQPVSMSTPTGLPYCVTGEYQAGKRGIQQIPQQEREHLLQRNPTAAAYFKLQQLMFYYPPGAVGIYGLEMGRLKFLRDHCADVNIITRKAAQQLRLPLVASKTMLSTSSNPEVSTQEEVNPRGIQLILLPGTQHATALNLTQTLVVDNTLLFDFLVGNEQMHAVADSITQYPTAQLHFLPNLLENPGYVVTIPMSSIKHPAHATAAAFRRTACITSSSVQGSAPITKLGGGCTVKKAPCSAVTSAGDLAKWAASSGLWAFDTLITSAAPPEHLKLEPAKPPQWTTKRKKFMPNPPPGARVYQPMWTWKAPMAMALLALLLLQLCVVSYVAAAVSPKVLLQDGGPCTEAVVFGASSELLDLLMPSTMQQIGLLMAVCAPTRYITEGDEARINWLRKRQLEGRLALSPAGQKVWIMLFATVALKEALLRPVEEMWELI